VCPGSWHAFAVAVFVVDALAFDVAELAQGLAESFGGPFFCAADDACLPQFAEMSQ